MALCAIVFPTSCGTGNAPETGSAEAAAQLQKDLKGTYEELFSEKTLLNPKWDAFWLSECEKAVGKDAAQATVEVLKASMSGTLTGEAATERFGDGSDGWLNGFQFNCDFKQGVSRFVFDGKGGIKGFDASGNELFSHEYVFDSYNADYDSISSSPRMATRTSSVVSRCVPTHRQAHITSSSVMALTSNPCQSSVPASMPTGWPPECLWTPIRSSGSRSGFSLRKTRRRINFLNNIEVLRSAC